jgi:hypothetical protein
VRALLSFNPEDIALAEAFRASLYVMSSDLEVFLSPIFFEEDRPLGLKHADAMLLFVGRRGLTDRQLREYHAAIERKERDSRFVMIPILAARAQAPQILTCNVAWLDMPVVTDHGTVRHVVSALHRELTEHVDPKN